jgi:hypothetical protein
VATAAIDVHSLDQIPPLCAKTGVPTERVRRQEFADLPGWTLLLILWGVVPFLIAAIFARRKVEVELPASADTLRRLRTIDFGSIGGFVVGVGLVVTAIVNGDGSWAWWGLGLMLVSLLVGAIARHVVWVSGRLENGVVWLYGLHPAFAEALEPFARAGVKPNDPRLGIVLLTGAIVLFGVLLIWWLRLST